MLKSSLIAGMLIAASLSPASAVVSGPQSSKAITEAADGATPVVWRCGPFRCVWRPGWRGVVPRWAVWGPPRLPGCFYEKRRRGWIEICP